MLNIAKGEPWVFWPSNICSSFPENPGNKILVGKEVFAFGLTFTLLEESETEQTLFTIVPSYTGVSIFKDKLTFILTSDNGVRYEEISYKIEVGVPTSILLVNNPDLNTQLVINGNIVCTIDDNIKGDSEPHILFGAGNFPSNGDNLNYCPCTLRLFYLVHNHETIAVHHFNEFIHGKSVDLTGNCNFLNKI